MCCVIEKDIFFYDVFSLTGSRNVSSERFSPCSIVNIVQSNC